MRIRYFFLLFLLFGQSAFCQKSEGFIQDSSIDEVLPQYPGGEEAMLKFIYSNLKYPAIARENGIEGIVVVRFVISKAGEVINATITKSVAKIIDQEALKVIQMMPLWTPGLQKGKPVMVQYDMPITFKLGGEKRKRIIIDSVLFSGPIHSGVNLEGSLSYGVISGEMKKYFSDSYGIEFGTNFIYKKMRFDARFHISRTQVKEDFIYKDLTWDKNRKTIFGNYKLNVGYKMNRGVKSEIVPFIGLGYGSFSPLLAIEDQPIKNFKAFVPSIGVYFIKYFRFTEFRIDDYQNRLIKFKIDYSPLFFNDEFKGGILTFGVGYGIGRLSSNPF